MPHTLELVNPACCLLVNQSSPIPQLLLLCGLNLAMPKHKLKIGFAWFHCLNNTFAEEASFCCLKVYQPQPPYSFFLQHSLQLTLEHASFSLPNQRYLRIAPLIFLRILLEPPQIMIKNHTIERKTCLQMTIMLAMESFIELQ